MLDPQMAYSCGYWRQASDLATAQDHKLRLVCEKLQLQPGMRLLDIGCGWGSLAAYEAAEKARKDRPVDRFVPVLAPRQSGRLPVRGWPAAMRGRKAWFGAWLAVPLAP
jgi:hypothetical protein